AACTTIFAAGTRPPLASWTTPRSVPRGFCASSANGRNATETNRKSAVLKKPRRFRLAWLLILTDRLKESGGLLPQVVAVPPSLATPGMRPSLRNRARIIAHCLYELIHLFIVPEIESAHPVDTEVQS